MEPQRTLTDLPFEVLDLIFKALAQKPLYGPWNDFFYDYSTDKLSLAQASEYLGQAFAYHSRDSYKKAMSDGSYRSIPDEAWPVILSLCGTTVMEYEGMGCSWSTVVAKAVAQYCPNLQKLKFEVNSNNIDILISLIEKAKNAIRTLEFIYYSYDSPIDPIMYKFSDSLIYPKIMHKFPELPLLTKLKIRNICSVDEAYQIQRFLNIEELELHSAYRYYGEDPRPLNLFQVCAPLKKLRWLKVVDVHIVSETDEDETIPPFPVLEHFELQSCVISMEFPNCPKLKMLEVLSCKSHIEGLVCRSVLKQGVDLERLIVDSRPSQFDNDSFLEVIRKYRKLRYFDVPIRKIKFHLEFVNEMLNALKENGVTQEDPLELGLDKVAKIHCLRRWLSYNSNSNLIKFLEE